MFIFFPNYFSPCNCFISSAMIKNNQIIVRSFDTNWRRLLNSTAAVLDVRGRSLREEEEEDVSTGSAQCPCTTVPVLQPHWLLQGSWGSTSATFHTSPTTLYMFLMENERTSGIVLPPVMCGCVQHRASGNTEGAWNRFRGHLLSVRVQKLCKWEARWWPPQCTIAFSVESNERKYFQKKNKVIFLGYLLSHSSKIFHISTHNVSHRVSSSARKIQHKWHHSGCVSAEGMSRCAQHLAQTAPSEAMIVAMAATQRDVAEPRKATWNAWRMSFSTQQ